jgi:hypothetical protein
MSQISRRLCWPGIFAVFYKGKVGAENASDVVHGKLNEISPYSHPNIKIPFNKKAMRWA